MFIMALTKWSIGVPSFWTTITQEGINIIKIIVDFPGVTGNWADAEDDTFGGSDGNYFGGSSRSVGICSDWSSNRYCGGHDGDVGRVDDEMLVGEMMRCSCNEVDMRRKVT
jgi:hypothetical protein